ncbi:phosphoserine phosphatase SerB [Alteromonadaceae bacterium M269]|nr:phosphoserine phosphatase SerB [Alteromonadaceae bacterium M269]
MGVRPTLSQPGLLVMDMDSTVIQVECIDEIAKLAGVGDEVANVTELAMQGKLDFSESLIQRVGCLKGTSVDVLQQVCDGLPLMPGVENLVNTFKSHGWKIAIASGGFTFFADYLRERLELDAAFSNELEVVDDKLTGRVVGNIVDAQVKADVVASLAEKFGIPQSQTVAMGDGANDLVMMKKAALGVGCHAKPKVRLEADCAIRFGGLDSLLALL